MRPDHLDHFGRQILLRGALLDAIDDLLNAPLHDGAFARRHLELPSAIDVAETLGDQIDERRVDAVDLGAHFRHVGAFPGPFRVHRC